MNTAGAHDGFPGVRCALALLLAALLGGAPAAAAEGAAGADAAPPARGPRPLRALDRAHVSALVVGERLCLEHRHIDATSLVVSHGDRRLLAGRDFLLDVAASCLTFPDPRAFLGARLEIDYEYFPFPLAVRYAHREQAPLDLAAAVPPDTVIPVERRERVAGAAPGAGGRLQIRGNKSFAVRVGSNRDASLSQSLDLDVSGEVASGVELRAILTDRDLPLQPAGDTETLDQLDKVMLEVRSRSMAATLGDYDVTAFGGSFLSYSKRLSGVKGEGKAGGREFVLAAALAKGEFISFPVPAIEGKQGPYVLADAAGNANIVVVAGSETVWLNGERLTRGENNDYTIDYSRAEITFTARRLITRDSRITADFEYTTESFKRNFYVGGARAALFDGKFTLGASVVSESDDAGDPLAPLTDSERTVLAAAGDTLRSTAAQGGVFVGAGEGDYLAIGGVDGEPLRYQYAGDGRGDYRVSFLNVGLGAGDYSDSLTAGGARAYRWVGTGSGSYEPGRILAAPESHQVLDLTGQSRFGALEFTGEFAASGLDLNTLSAVDDLDNGGLAAGLRAAYAPTVTVAGREVRIAARGGYRDVGADFRTLGRIRPADYAYSWNAPANAFARGERLTDGGLDVTPIAGLTVGADLSATEGDAFAGRRTGATVTLARRLAGRFRLERTSGEEKVVSGAVADSSAALAADRDRAYEYGELSTAIGRFTPRAHYERDERIEWRGAVRSGLGYTVFGGGTEVRLPARSRFSVDLRRRNDRAIGTGAPWAATVDAFEQSYRLEIPRVSTVSVSGGFTRRTAEDRLRGTEQVSDLVQLDVVHSSQGGGIESETHADVTTTDVSGDDQELVYAGEGQGVYDEYGRYVGPGGDYVLRKVGPGTPDLRTRFRVGARLEVRPRRFLGPPAALTGGRRVLAALGAETTIQLDELTRLDLASPRYFLSPDSYQREDATFRGSAYLRQDFDLFENNRLLSLRLRGERRDELDNRIAGVSKDLATRSTGVRFRSSPWTPLSAELEQTWGRATETETAVGQGESGGAQSSFDLDTGVTTLDLTGRPGRDMRLGIVVRRAVEQARTGDAEATTLEIGPNATTHWRRARLDLRYRRVNEERSGVFPPSYRAGSRPGTRSEYGVNVDYRPFEHVTLTGGVEGLRPPASAFTHTARFEVRIFF